MCDVRITKAASLAVLNNSNHNDNKTTISCKA
ncbi:MAG: hypothetical protein GDYSWBUE_001791 [Candidatus Fervidibacterota bacterium]